MLLSAFFDLYVYNSTAGFPEYVCAYLFVYFVNNTKKMFVVVWLVLIEKLLFFLFLVTDFI